MKKGPFAGQHLYAYRLVHEYHTSFNRVICLSTDYQVPLGRLHLSTCTVCIAGLTAQHFCLRQRSQKREAVSFHFLANWSLYYAPMKEIYKLIWVYGPQKIQNDSVINCRSVPSCGYQDKDMSYWGSCDLMIMHVDLPDRTWHINT